MKYILVTLAFSLIMQYTHAQMASDSINAQTVPADTAINPAARWYAKETIYLVGGNMYMKNGKPLMGKKKLLNEFSISSWGIAYADRVRDQAFWIRNYDAMLKMIGEK